MMDAAKTVGPVFVGAGVCGVLGGGGDGGVAESSDVDDGVVQAVGDALWSGDSGSLGGVGVSGGGEASAISGDEGGVDGGETDDVRGVDGGGVVGGIADGGVTGGGVTAGGVAGADRGERSSLLTSSRSRSNSTSFRLRLVLFAGGEWTSGEESIGWEGGGGEVACSVEIPPVAVTGGDDCAGSSPAVVAARPRLRRQR
jgi:hypothetical protein